jgi:hypothetical protein
VDRVVSPLAWPGAVWHWYLARIVWAAPALVCALCLVASVVPWRADSGPLAVPWAVALALVGMVRHLHYKATAEGITGPLNALPETHVLALLTMLADPDVPPEWKPALEAAEPDLERLAHLHADVREILTRESDKRRRRVARLRRRDPEHSTVPGE